MAPISGFKRRQDGFPEGEVLSASSLEGKNEAFPLTPAEVLRFALFGPVCHVPICEPVLVTMWIKGSDWSGLEWSPTQTLWAET